MMTVMDARPAELGRVARLDDCAPWRHDGFHLDRSFDVNVFVSNYYLVGLIVGDVVARRRVTLIVHYVGYNGYFGVRTDRDATFPNTFNSNPSIGARLARWFGRNSGSGGVSWRSERKRYGSAAWPRTVSPSTDGTIKRNPTCHDFQQRGAR
jgi:hypothetical protein